MLGAKGLHSSGMLQQCLGLPQVCAYHRNCWALLGPRGGGHPHPMQHLPSNKASDDPSCITLRHCQPSYVALHGSEAQ